MFFYAAGHFQNLSDIACKWKKVCRLRANDDTGLQSWFEVKKNMVFVWFHTKK